MHILFCNYEYPPIGGGGGVANQGLAEELVRIGHSATVLTTQSQGLSTLEDVNGVRLVRIPVLGRKARSHASLISLLSYVAGGILRPPVSVIDEKFDIVNTQFAVPTGPLGTNLAKRLALPNVLTVHGGDVHDPSKFLSPHRHFALRAVVKNVVRSCFCTVAGSSDVAGHLKNDYGLDEDIRVVNYGIKPPPLRDETVTRADFGIAEDDFVLIAIGRVVPRKQMDHLVEAVAQLKSPRAKLLVLGDGPEIPRLAKLAADRGIEDQVIFKGFVSEKEKFDALYLSDVFAYTSLHEGFGLVFVEAMSCGLPVVSYNNGGQMDVLTDSNSVTVQVNDLNRFVEACTKLMNNPAEHKRKARGAAADAERFFIAEYAKRYESVFEEAIRMHDRRCA